MRLSVSVLEICSSTIRGISGDVHLGLERELWGETKELWRHEGSYSNWGNMDIPPKKNFGWNS